jgi:hypothetical protein
MRKTSRQTTNTTGAAAHATSPAVAHGQFPSPPVIDNCETSSWPWSPDDFSPIEWWRSLPADRLGDAQHLLLRATLDKICVMKGHEWLSAMQGNAAASIAIAVEMFPIGEITLEVDLAMTVVMLSALDGNAAAALVLSRLLGRAPLDHPFAKDLSVSWLVLNLRRALNASKMPDQAGAGPKASSSTSTGTAPSLVGSLA